VGGYLIFHMEKDGETISKKFTPVSSVIEKGHVTFVIKIYRPCEEYPNGGRIT